jgi:BirA family biotin operon repressor/biotin-[acetyl-CoA-carboxylase] ligase
MRLDPAAAGVRLLAYETLASTNAEALALARRGERNPVWVTARRQTAGRGRRGNEWMSPPGNLYATLLLRDPGPAERAPELSFVAGLAVHDAILRCAGMLGQQLALKWPNDVLCDGAKLAGILIEGEGVDGGLAIAIGIGVNCAHHPANTTYPATDLAAAGTEISPGELFTALSGTMPARLAQWNCGAGFAAVRADWIDRAAGIGGEIRVRLPGRELSGMFEALDEHGRLMLRLADKNLQAITAGDVFPVGERPVRASVTGRVN